MTRMRIFSSTSSANCSITPSNRFTVHRPTLLAAVVSVVMAAVTAVEAALLPGAASPVAMMRVVTGKPATVAPHARFVAKLATRPFVVGIAYSHG
jgi:hypothetical protein